MCTLGFNVNGGSIANSVLEKTRDWRSFDLQAAHAEHTQERGKNHAPYVV